jgi:hypothetical protein
VRFVGYIVYNIVKAVDTILARDVGWKLATIFLLACALLGWPLRAQTPAPTVPPAPPPVAEENAPFKLPQEALNQLLSPIALYPDALVALILPASTVPSDVVLAARYLSASGDKDQIANQPWDDSVKSLAHYPDIIKWMDQNLEWTTQLGDAFLNQPADVMNTIQQLRAEAIAAGNLVDTPQQRIVKEESCIRIVPAEPEVIYVPQYDPEVVYVQPYAPYLGPALTFGIGFAVGSWLNFDCDWPRHRVCVGDWNPRWRHDWDSRWKDDWNAGWKRDWNRNRGGDFAVVNINTNTARVWEPSQKARRQHLQRQRNFNNNALAFNANRRSGDVNDPVRRSPRVARPSLPNFSNQANDGDRRGGRRSNLARNLPGETRNAGALPGPRSIQAERFNRGDGNREGREKARARKQSDLPRNLRNEIRNPDALPGPQFQTERPNRGNGNREGSGRGRWREQSDSQSKAMARVQAGRSSGGGNAGKADNLRERRGRGDSGSVESRKSSRSVSGQSSRSKRSESVRSRANDSSQKFKAGRSKASHSGNKAQSFSKANKRAEGVNRSKGGSQRQVAAARQQHRAQSGGGGGNRRGGGEKSGQKGGRGKDKGGD